MTMDKPREFPPFSLTRLLRTVFHPKPGERVRLLIDLPNPAAARDFAFLRDPALTIQRHAHDTFFCGLRDGGLQELGLVGGELYAYEITGGSNLDLPDACVGTDGTVHSLERDIYPNADIVLCLSTYSATAPLTAFAKRFGFRGATLHGVNDIILRTGLAVDYDQVSREAEKLRLALTRADAFEIDFDVLGRRLTLRLRTDAQEAQKSHGLCRGEKPDIANLPAGEVYFVPAGAEGQFPLRYEDGTIGCMDVRDGRIQRATLLQGRPETVVEHNARLSADPMIGVLGELGFGTQRLPVSGRDIQDEKILGTLHVATGRSDHLGGNLTPEKFATPKNATHDDILFAPHKTPEVQVTQVRMVREGRSTVVLENFEPAEYLRRALAG